MLNRGKVFIISGPSGSGKTTLIDLLHQEFPQMVKNVSCTTRAKREEEVDGVDYFFITDKEFDEKLAKDEFLEHITLFGSRYGASKYWIEDRLNEGCSVFLVIDVQGAKSLTAKNKTPSIFIRPKSIEVLRERLRKRGATESQIEPRLKRAEIELVEGSEYDYQVINDDLKTAYQELKDIVIKELK